MPASRRLAAILVADVAGYSRLVGADEEGTLTRLRELRRELVDPAIEAHNGRIVKTTGDGILVEFFSVVDAVRCAVALQNGVGRCNCDVPPERRITLRAVCRRQRRRRPDDDIHRRDAAWSSAGADPRQLTRQPHVLSHRP
jgi:class 3 adenylate cyclase